MRRALDVFLLSALATVLVACGSTGKPETPKNTAGMDPKANAATVTKFFDAVASNDPVKVEAAYALAAPGSPALSYLTLLRGGLQQPGQASRVTADNGHYLVCLASMPTSCHTFAAVVLTDGKVNDFTVDGKKIRIR
ncbi:MAG: hypothetical protein ACJ72O_14450 [Marmoricola sp.]